MLTDDQIKRLIAERLRTARDLKHLTQRDAGALIGVEQETWANYERGVRGIDAVTLVKVSREFGYPLEFFTEPNYQITLKHVPDKESKKSRRRRDPAKEPARG